MNNIEAGIFKYDITKGTLIYRFVRKFIFAEFAAKGVIGWFNLEIEIPHGLCSFSFMAEYEVFKTRTEENNPYPEDGLNLIINHGSFLIDEEKELTSDMVMFPCRLILKRK